jgi:hypothetical protein
VNLKLERHGVTPFQLSVNNLPPTLSMAQVRPQPLPNIVPIPPPVIGPQPNFGVLDNHMQGVAQEIALLRNMPGPAIQDQLLHLREQSIRIIERLDLLTDAVNDTRNTLFGVQNTVVGIQNTLARQPQQLYNSTASMDAPLLYPPGIQMVDAFPLTKKDLMNITAANCNAAIRALGMDAPPAGAPIAARRQILMDYLGTGMRA